MSEDPRDWEVETRLVRGGMARSGYGEISEALFLTQSFAYDSAGHLIVSEVMKSAASSYSVSSSGVLTVITPSLVDFGKAACWTVNSGLQVVLSATQPDLGSTDLSFTGPFRTSPSAGSERCTPPGPSSRLKAKAGSTSRRPWRRRSNRSRGIPAG